MRACIGSTLSACVVTVCFIVLFGGVSYAETPSSSSDAHEFDGTRLVILGTAAGRTSWKGLPSGGISSAVEVNGQVYIVDFGRDWEDHFFQAGLGSNPARGVDAMGHGLETLKAGFITHLHGDHIVGLSQLILFGASDGLANRDEPFQLYGPGPRGALYTPPEAVAQPADIVSPEQPTPGTVGMFNTLLAAYATGLNDNIINSGKSNPKSYISVHDIAIPPEVGASPRNPDPKMSPFVVYRDENVTVSAVLVRHGGMFPSFAYRFDTADGAIVFSSDKLWKKGGNLARLAKGADVLVHEVIDPQWVKTLFPEPRTDVQNAKAQQLLHHLHTTPSQVGKTASEAGVDWVVLTHLAPPTLDHSATIDKVQEYFGGDVVVAEPFMAFRLDDGHVSKRMIKPMTKPVSIMN